MVDEKKTILKKLESIKELDKKIEFLENTIKNLKDKKLIEELKEILEELKFSEPEFVSHEKFSNIKLKVPQKEQNLEETIINEAPLVEREKTKETNYLTNDYGTKKDLYKDAKIEGKFFDTLKSKLGNAGLLPNDMIFKENNINDIKLYMKGMNLPEDKIEKYVDRIIDLKHELYNSEKTKSIGMFNVEYERE
ncbi:MAG: hypothetical protein PHF86_03995 [Candidatus Nanoarchaeia archaeon]|nr:hypothetical protein [Candidatus Nanoarchaeia archaeon]